MTLSSQSTFSFVRNYWSVKFRRGHLNLWKHKKTTCRERDRTVNQNLYTPTQTSSKAQWFTLVWEHREYTQSLNPTTLTGLFKSCMQPVGDSIPVMQCATWLQLPTHVNKQCTCRYESLGVTERPVHSQTTLKVPSLYWKHSNEVISSEQWHKTNKCIWPICQIITGFI